MCSVKELGFPRGLDTRFCNSEGEQVKCESILMISTRPSYWESSRRPLYPKWVWSDVIGHRHFIIDHDIHQVKYTTSNNLVHNKRTAIGLVPKAVSFDLVADRRNGTMDDTRRMSDAVGERQQSKRSVGRRNTYTPKPSVTFLKRELNRRLAATKQEDGERNSLSEVNQSAVESSNQKNPLADRVIHWLDLAGRNTLIRSEDMTIERGPVQRVCTTESLFQRPSHHSGSIRRSESVHMLSLTFNETLHLSKQNDCEQFALKSFSSANRASRSILGAHRDTAATHHKPLRHSASEFPTNSDVTNKSDMAKVHFGTRSRKPSATGKQSSNSRKSSSANAINNDDIEKQYRSLIQRQILEKSCNIQAARRQLHIFMPGLPDKIALAPGGLGDGDSSYLSTILGSGI